MQNKKDVQYEQVDVKIPVPELGYEITLDDINNKIVKLHLYKGKTSAQDIFELGRVIMFRVKIQFVGDLSKYLPIDAAAARETIETVDLDLDLLEIFFKKKQKTQAVKRMFSSMVDTYMGVSVGHKVGTITMSYKNFSEFVVFIRYLSFASFDNNMSL